MSTQTTRLDEIERQIEEFRARLASVEARPASVPHPETAVNGDSGSSCDPDPPPVPLRRAPAARPTPVRSPAVAAPPVPTTPRPTFEQLLGGRVLAWLGGAAVLAGLAFLFALGVSSGWLDESRRCVLGALAAGGLVGAGAWLQETRGRTTATLAAVGAGVAGLYLAIGFATSAYDLLPPLGGAVLAVAVGALGTTLALRWDSSAVAGLGLVGAALAPAVSGALGEPGGLPLLWVAAAAGVAVVVRRRWGWLGVALATAATPQWVGTLGLDGTPHLLTTILLTLVAFGALGYAAALGHELRVPLDGGLRPSSTFLLAGTPLTLGLAGYALVDDAAGRTAALVWLAALATAHLLGGAVLRRSDRLTDELAVLVLVLGTALADVAFGLALDGAPRAIGWTLSTVGFAWLTRRTRGDLDPVAAQAGLGVHLALAAVTAGSALQPALAGDGLGVAAGATLACFAAGALASARLAPALRAPLDVTGLLALALLAALTLDGTALTLAYASEAVALGVVSRRADDELAGVASLVHLLGALGWCLLDQASPAGLARPVAHLGTASLGVAIVAAAATRLAWEARRTETEPGLPEALATFAAVAALYLASLVAVALPHESGAVNQGQLQLTALWATVGVVALLAGLRRDVPRLRAAALGLLALSAGKLFLIDLATLAAAWRVVACLGVGLLLLLGAYLHARLRPEPDRRPSAMLEPEMAGCAIGSSRIGQAPTAPSPRPRSRSWPHR